MIRLALGVPGSGKSICLQDCARNAVAQGWPVLAVDRAGEWFPDAMSYGMFRWRNHPPPIEILTTQSDVKELFEREQESELEPAVYVFNGFESVDVARYATQLGNVIIIDDEIDFTAPINCRWQEHPMRDMVHRGRHLPNRRGEVCEIHLWGAARRVQSIHTDITSMADEVFVFRVAGTRTTKRIQDEYAFSDEQIAEAIRLPNMHYFKWSSVGSIGRGYLTALPNSKNAPLDALDTQADSD